MYEKAAESYRNAIKINPNDADYHCNLGIALKNLGRNEEAVNSYGTAIKINPNDAMYYDNLGDVFFKNSLFE